MKHIQAFLGLASFYRKFIKQFSAIAAPLMNCLKKKNFARGTKQQESFDNIRDKLSSSSVLKLLEFS